MPIEHLERNHTTISVVCPMLSARAVVANISPSGTHHFRVGACARRHVGDWACFRHSMSGRLSCRLACWEKANGSSRTLSVYRPMKYQQSRSLVEIWSKSHPLRMGSQSKLSISGKSSSFIFNRHESNEIGQEKEEVIQVVKTYTRISPKQEHPIFSQSRKRF
jgi:ribosomal protein L31